MKYFDLHCDTVSKCIKNSVLPGDISLAASLEKGKIFSEWRQCFAVFISDDSSNPKNDYLSQTNYYKIKFRNDDAVKPILTLENALAIDSSDFVDVLVYDGISAVTLTWNNENSIAGGACTEVGLKPFGREIIAKLNDKHIAVDLSHLNKKSFFEVADCSNTVFASHSCCYKTHRHIRNLTDDQIKLIAERGGLIGICYYPEFLGTKYVFEGVWRHIFHLLNLGYEKNIAFGSDFDGAVMSPELDGVDKIPFLYDYLHNKGVGKTVLDNMFFNNAELFFKNL